MVTEPGKKITIEVACTVDEEVYIVPLQVINGATILDAIKQSGVLERFPRIDLAVNKVGVFSQRRELDSVLMEGDRIEIYRPLKADPKETRRRRAAAKKSGQI